MAYFLLSQEKRKKKEIEESAGREGTSTAVALLSGLKTEPSIKSFEKD